jgi:quercetin dioxygenase-like cupin family protein
MTTELTAEDNLIVKPNEDIRFKIAGIESKISQLPEAKFGDYLPLKHTFAENVYVREIFIPKGELVVGKIHKHSHPNFLMKGKVSVLTEEGSKTLEAPMSIISPAGTKRVVYAHEDTIWITVHVTDKTDLLQIEDEIIAKSYDELLPEYAKKFIESKTLEGE